MGADTYYSERLADALRRRGYPAFGIATGQVVIESASLPWAAVLHDAADTWRLTVFASRADWDHQDELGTIVSPIGTDNHDFDEGGENLAAWAEWRLRWWLHDDNADLTDASSAIASSDVLTRLASLDPDHDDYPALTDPIDTPEGRLACVREVWRAIANLQETAELMWDAWPVPEQVGRVGALVEALGAAARAAHAIDSSEVAVPNACA